jgi:thymidylate kinase
MLRIRASDLESLLFTIEDIIESYEDFGKEAPTLFQKLQRYSQQIPQALFQEFVEAAKILITPSNRRLGQFVVVTGIDKSGKETQAFNPEHKPRIISLHDYFVSRAFDVLILALPSYHTAFGSLIASYLGKENPTVTIAGDLSKDIAWVLWSLDRAQHNPEVAKWLEGNQRNIVLSKRWTDSNIAYQGPLGISEKRILRFERNLVKADYTIVLDVPLDLVFRRMEVSGEIPDKYETPEFLSKVSSIYENLEHFYPVGKILHIDGSGSFEEVNARLIKTISSMKLSASLPAVSERFG